MNDILRPLTADGLVGWDQFNQLWLWRVDGKSRSGTVIADVREKTCPVCNRGWEATAESLGDQYHWDSRKQWVHESCFVRYQGLTEHDFWHEALCGVFRFQGLKEIPNEYRGAWNTPWYRIPLSDVPRTLKLGTRKRVYHMEIEEEAAELPPPRDAEEGARRLVAKARMDFGKAEALFASEDVTKSFGPQRVMIHAWTREKARQYLRKFAEILGLESRTP